MTRTTNARLAGFTFLFYIAVGLTSLTIENRATSAEGTAAKLARLAEHAADVRATLVLTVLTSLSALVLAVTLHALTRDEDADLALLALTCRVGEGLLPMVGIPATLGLLRLAISAAAPGAPDPAAANALGGYLLSVRGGEPLVSAILFAVGSTLFCYLFLRARSIPTALAWFGVLASVLLMVALPAQLGGVLKGPATTYVWMPMLLFEVAFGLWLVAKGVATRAAG
jgi:hypothetical protein